MKNCQKKDNEKKRHGIRRREEEEQEEDGEKREREAVAAVVRVQKCERVCVRERGEEREREREVGGAVVVVVVVQKYQEYTGYTESPAARVCIQLKTSVAKTPRKICRVSILKRLLTYRKC